MSIRSLQLLSHFALPPNKLQYCGKNSAAKAFADCITKDKCNQVKKETKHFIVLWPYLKTIGEATNKDPFSYDVVEAYWYGNDLLKQIKPSHYQLLLKNLQTQGVPKFLIDELKEKPPKKFVPIHLFNILHVGVGRASGAVPFNLKNVNHCMIRWGEITNITPPNPLFIKEGKNSSPLQKGRSGVVLSKTTINLHSLTKTKSETYSIKSKLTTLHSPPPHLPFPLKLATQSQFTGNKSSKKSPKKNNKISPTGQINSLTQSTFRFQQIQHLPHLSLLLF
jgi:hypothetical protein